MALCWSTQDFACMFVLMPCNRHSHNRSFSLISSNARPFGSPILWHVANLTPDMPKTRVLLAFTEAFAVWQEVLNPIQFAPTADAGLASVIIRFATSRTAPQPFGPGVLAYAGPVGPGGKGFVYVNEAIQWGEAATPGALELRKVLTHEIGHVLNSDHSHERGCIMFPSYQASAPIILSAGVRRGVRSFYRLDNPPAPVTNVEGLAAALRQLWPNRSALSRATWGQLQALASLLSVSVQSRSSLIGAIDNALG
jgi:hypothetical protein